MIVCFGRRIDFPILKQSDKVTNACMYELSSCGSMAATGVVVGVRKCPGMSGFLKVFRTFLQAMAGGDDVAELNAELAEHGKSAPSINGSKR